MMKPKKNKQQNKHDLSRMQPDEDFYQKLEKPLKEWVAKNGQPKE